MEKNSEYSLKWNNHQSTVLTAMNTLYTNERHADCILAAEGKSLKVHKLMISACSPYLEKLLEEYSTDKSSQPIIIFNDVSFSELKALCEYMYKGEVNVSQERLDSFLKVARNMQIRGLCDQGSSEATAPAVTTPPPAAATPQPKPEKAKLLAKRKREGPSDPPPWDGKQAKVKRSETPVATCSPVRMKPDVKPPDLKDVKTEEEEYDDNYQDYGNEMYQDSNSAAGPSSESLEYPWSEGGNEFTSDNGTIDQDVEMFYCLTCGKMYKKMKSLRSHLRYECGKIPTYACPHCPYKSKQKGYLNQHINIKHTESSQVYQCEICGYSTKYKSNYNIHMKSSHIRRKRLPSEKSKDSKEVFLCSSCGSMFSKASLLTRHMKTSCNTSLFKCPFCSYTDIKTKVSLHVKAKHDPNSSVAYRCSHCHFMTKSLSLLQTHVEAQHKTGKGDEMMGGAAILISTKSQEEEEEEIIEVTQEEEIKEEYSEIVEQACSEEIMEETVVLTEETQGL